MLAKDMDLSRHLVEAYTVDGRCYLMCNHNNFYVFNPKTKLWGPIYINTENYGMSDLRGLVNQKIINKPFHADLVTEDYYSEHNIFRGFAAKRVDTFDERLNKILDYIFKVLADSNPDNYRKIISWLAEPLKTLTPNTEFMILVGKDCGFKIFIMFLLQYVYKGSESYVDGLTHNPNLGLLTIFDTDYLDKEIKNYINTNTSYLITVANADITNCNYLCFKACDIVSDDDEYFDDLCKSCLNEDVGNMFYTYLRDFNSYPMVKSSNSKIQI